jgi:DNA replication protein DnaC
MSADALGLLLKAFRLPTMAQIYQEVAQQAEQQGWGYRKFLQHLCEAEAQDRAERKLERLLKQSELPGGKTLGSRIPMFVRT